MSKVSIYTHALLCIAPVVTKLLVEAWEGQVTSDALMFFLFAASDEMHAPYKGSEAGG